MNKLQTNKVEKIRESYLSKETTDFDKLKALDKKVKLPARIFAYTLGIVFSLVFGAGMCFAMKVIGNSLSTGLCLGLGGMAFMLVNYPLYKVILKHRKNKYAHQIIELSSALLND